MKKTNLWTDRKSGRGSTQAKNANVLGNLFISSEFDTIAQYIRIFCLCRSSPRFPVRPQICFFHRVLTRFLWNRLLLCRVLHDFRRGYPPHPPRTTRSVKNAKILQVWLVGRGPSQPPCPKNAVKHDENKNARAGWRILRKKRRKTSRAPFCIVKNKQNEVWSNEKRVKRD